jgi:peptidoglycan/LPS O-acetylase OafA/YrhL/lysophospholipase L1-like esterase
MTTNNSKLSTNAGAAGGHLDWLDPLKALALLAILLNHLVEEFGKGPWFTNPSQDWPSLADRLSNIYPTQFPFPISLVQFLGWLGDSGPGVFILVSGFGLTWAALNRGEQRVELGNFYRRRLLRIFPLYIAIHLIILAVSLIVPGSSYTLASPMTLLSLLGLRFTDSLFFYINPSWWFIWLIIQLYVVFPFLFRLLQRSGVRNFLIITLAFTFASRFLGIMGVRYSQGLYFWMTGIFFGTRLAEFVVGMAAAVWFFELQKVGRNMPPVGKILAWSLGVYLIGLGCSFTLPGTVVSNLLVTIGLSGLFYAFWEGVVKKVHLLAGVITWIGVEAYGVFLLHQTPLRWTRIIYDQYLHLVFALLVIALSFPTGWLINRCIAETQKSWRLLREKFPGKLVGWVGATGVAAALVIVEPRLWDNWKYRVFAMLLGICVVALFAAQSLADEKKGLHLQFALRWSAIGAGILQLFILPRHLGPAAVIIGVLFGAIGAVFWKWLPSRTKSLAASTATIALGILALESFLGYFAPLEAGRWGEYPALQIHPTRVYSLKPNKKIHLKYNNYDYILRTNSLGLPGPEIEPIEKTDGLFRILIIGDAFSMPEGMGYERAYPQLLQQKFDPGKVQVINAGVTGYGPVEELSQLSELVPLLKPDMVIYQFFINEFIEAHLRPDDRLKNIGLLPKGGSLRGNLMERSQLHEHFKKVRQQIKEAVTGRPSDYRFWKSFLHLYETGENRYYSPDSLDVLKDYLKSMKDVCSRNSTKMIIYFVPGAVAVSKQADISYFPWDENLEDVSKYDLNRPLKNLQDLAGIIGLPVMDLTTSLKSHEIQPVYFPDSWHWNLEGHKVVAATIYNDLKLRSTTNK